MPVFISYSRTDRAFVDTLAKNLVMQGHHVWLDRWELNVGDSLISKIQAALTESSAMLVILSRASLASEWCKKELNSGLIRELEEKHVLVVPCVIDDCSIPLFLREKLYADFRNSPDEAFNQVSDALLKITNLQQGRLENAGSFTDWSYDWKQTQENGTLFDFLFVEHGPEVPFCVLTQCKLFCNSIAANNFAHLQGASKIDYIHRAFRFVSIVTSKRKKKFQLDDAFQQFDRFSVQGSAGEEWSIELSCRRMGTDSGKNTLVHTDRVFEMAIADLASRGRQT